MSTKSSIFNGKKAHFYHECFDEDAVYLELQGDQTWFEASPDHVRVLIPAAVFEAMKQYPLLDFSLAKATDRDLRARVNDFIQKRRQWMKRDPKLGACSGSFVYGSGDDPVRTQVRRGMASLRKERAKQQRWAAFIKRHIKRL